MQGKEVQDEVFDVLRDRSSSSYVCAKHPFQNKKEAMSSVNRMGNKKEKAKRAYYCGHCGAWHITSTERHEVSDISILMDELEKLKLLITSGDSASKFYECKVLWGEVAKHFE
jgi:hypothetical protein